MKIVIKLYSKGFNKIQGRGCGEIIIHNIDTKPVYNLKFKLSLQNFKIHGFYELKNQGSTSTLELSFPWCSKGIILTPNSKISSYFEYTGNSKFFRYYSSTDGVKTNGQFINKLSTIPEDDLLDNDLLDNDLLDNDLLDKELLDHIMI
jgi:hypothetical protein